MPEKNNQLTCEEFQAQIPVLLGSGRDAKKYPHPKACPICLQLLIDLETIADAARYRQDETDDWSEST